MQQQRKLRIGLCLASLALVVAVGMLASSARSADDQKKEGAGAGGAAGATGMPQMTAEDMKKMMEMSKPGPEHQKLKDMAGTWEAEGKMFMPPGGKTTGTMTMKMVLGDRYLQMKFEGTSDMGMGAQPFHGQGLQGYDRVKKKYVGTWADDMGTGIMTSEGTCDGSTMTMEGSFMDPMTGQDCKTKEVTTIKDKDHMTYEMNASQGGSPMVKVFEINYTRKS
jgi:hypothetical protein